MYDKTSEAGKTRDKMASMTGNTGKAKKKEEKKKEINI